jgi:hypothetical protein
MKRVNYYLILAISAILFFQSCQKDDVFEASKPVDLVAEKINRKVSETEARSFLSAITKNLFNENPTLKSKNVVEDRDVEDLIPIVEEGDTLLFIANYKDQSGYMIISTDKVSFPILGFSDAGIFDPNNLTPSVQAWLDEAKERIANDIVLPVDTSDLHYKMWSNITVDEDGEIQLNIVEETGLKGDRTSPLNRPTIYALTSTEWGQGYGYNYYCPVVKNPYYPYQSAKAPAGCVAVAMGQIAKYWKYPTKWNYSAMPFKISNVSNNDVPNETGKMLREMGTDVSMYYAYNISTVSTSNIYKIVNAFRNYGYSNPGRLINYDFTQVYSSLQNKKPVIMLGIGTSGGHAWIAEGYYEMKIKVTETKKFLGIVVSKKEYYIWRDYLYMNWGDNGNQDGWYEHSTWVTNSGANFNNSKQVIVDIKK